MRLSKNRTSMFSGFCFWRRSVSNEALWGGKVSISKQIRQQVGSNSGRSVPAAHQQDKLYTRRDCHPGVWSRCLGFQRHFVVFFLLCVCGFRS